MRSKFCLRGRQVRLFHKRYRHWMWDRAGVQVKLLSLYSKMERLLPYNNDHDYEIWNKETGFGLELTLSQMLVKNLNNNSEDGQIKFITEVDKRSTFYFPIRSNVEEEIKENFNTVSSVNIKEIYKKQKNLSVFHKRESSEILSDKNISKEIRVFIVDVDDDPINIIGDQVLSQGKRF